MKIGIIYATKRQKATTQIVDWMKSELESNGHIVVAGKVNKFSDFECDHYIIGTAVYMFSIKKAGLVKFLKKNATQIEQKPVSLFIVCGAKKLPPRAESTDIPFIKFLKYTFINPDKYMQNLSNCFSKPPVAVHCFSGYQEEADKIKDNFAGQEQAVKSWIKSSSEQG